MGSLFEGLPETLHKPRLLLTLYAGENGAGEGNRTLVLSLGSSRLAIGPHPQLSSRTHYLFQVGL